MPWATPTLKRVRELVRDEVVSARRGAPMIGNNVLRVVSDAMAALNHLVLRYIDWLALQFLPDTAEEEWLDRHGDIWLTNSDGTTGRKMATLASGVVNISGVDGTLIPIGTRLGSISGIQYETLQDVILSDIPVPVNTRAIDPGIAGNLEEGDTLSVVSAGVDGSAVVVTMTGGTDTESTDLLRVRVLERIREPPQGGADHDYVRWTKAVPGVTRAWVYPLEMGPGTITVRFLMDDLRADNDGFPLLADIVAVESYLDTVRPVAVKDLFVVAPLKQRVDFHIRNLVPDTPAVRSAIEDSIRDMLYNLAKPGQTIFASWKSQAVLSAPGVLSFTIAPGYTTDDIMETPGHMAVLGDIAYD